VVKRLRCRRHVWFLRSRGRAVKVWWFRRRSSVAGRCMAAALRLFIAKLQPPSAFRRCFACRVLALRTHLSLLRTTATHAPFALHALPAHHCCLHSLQTRCSGRRAGVRNMCQRRRAGVNLRWRSSPRRLLCSATPPVLSVRRSARHATTYGTAGERIHLSGWRWRALCGLVLLALNAGWTFAVAPLYSTRRTLLTVISPGVPGLLIVLGYDGDV
jgi:hypothetical protein